MKAKPSDSLSSFLYFQMDGPLVKGEGKSWESLGLSARLKKGVERIREIKLDSSSFRDRLPARVDGNEEKRSIRVKTEKKEKADLEFEMEISAGGKLLGPAPSRGSSTQEEMKVETEEQKDGSIEGHHDGSVGMPRMTGRETLCADIGVANGNNSSDEEEGDRLLICGHCGKGFHLESSPRKPNQDDLALGEGPYSCTECGNSCWT
ncbi:hypothetical protein Chor_009498 [Crotalus horridus]